MESCIQVCEVKRCARKLHDVRQACNVCRQGVTTRQRGARHRLSGCRALLAAW